MQGNLSSSLFSWHQNDMRKKNNAYSHFLYISESVSKHFLSSAVLITTYLRKVFMLPYKYLVLDRDSHTSVLVGALTMKVIQWHLFQGHFFSIPPTSALPL